jgi:biotin synthase-like enzyme
MNVIEQLNMLASVRFSMTDITIRSKAHLNQNSQACLKNIFMATKNPPKRVCGLAALSPT